MTALYMRFAQQEHADDMFNRGIANMAAGFSPISQRAAIAASGAGQTQDPGTLFSNIMQLQQYRQQQLGALDAAKTLGITPNEAMAMPQDSIRTAMALNIQPEDLRKYNAFENQFAQQHQNDPGPDGQPIGQAGARKLFEQQVPMTTMVSGGDTDVNKLNLEHAQYLSTHNGEEPPDNRFSTPDALAAYKAHTAALGASQTAAGSTLPALSGALTTMRQNATDIQNSPDLDTVLAKATANPSLIDAARSGGWGPTIAAKWGMTPNQLELLHKIDELSSFPTAPLKANNQHLLPSLSTLDTTLTPLRSFDVGAANYKTRLGQTIDAIDTTSGEAIGASGQLEKAIKTPAEAKVDSSYLPGGKNFLGESKRLPPDEIAQARAAIAQGAPPAAVVQRLKLRGFLPRPGEIPGA
jgi:hypothetical protein